MGLRHTVGNALARWPALQDFASLGRGRSFAELGMTDSAISGFTRTLHPRIREADTVVPSVCPYCAVGCAQWSRAVHHDGRRTVLVVCPHRPAGWPVADPLRASRVVFAQPCLRSAVESGGQALGAA